MLVLCLLFVVIAFNAVIDIAYTSADPTVMVEVIARDGNNNGYSSCHVVSISACRIPSFVSESCGAGFSGSEPGNFELSG